MTEATEINDLKKVHESLYGTAVREHAELLKDAGALQDFLGKVDDFLGDVERTSTTVTSVHDFNWLTDAALKWQVVFSSVLNVPRSIQSLPVPDQLATEVSADPTLLDEQDVHQEISELAYQQSLIRKANFLLERSDLLLHLFPSSGEDMEADWGAASAVFSTKVLEGRIHFIRQMTSDSYHWLEERWISEVKRSKAYFIWVKKSAEEKVKPGLDRGDYESASESLRSLLLNESLKVANEEFELPRRYIQERYLTDARIDTGKGTAHELVARKAYRIWQVTGDSDEKKNWESAEAYCRLFYENIIPAVAEGGTERTLLALKAFQHSRSRPHSFLINSFEVALAIYFLSAAVVREIWESSPFDPERDYMESRVEVADFGEGWLPPTRFAGRLRYESPNLVFQGVMTKAELGLLQSLLPMHREEMEALFKQSRLLPRQSTL